MFIQNSRGVALHSIFVQDTILLQNSRGVTLRSIRSAPIQDSPGAALYSILIQDSRGVALHSNFILEVLRDVTLELRAARAPS